MTVRPVLALILLIASLASPGRAQERLVVRTESGTPVVAVEVLIASDPRDEEGVEGLRYLSARTVLAPIRAALDSLGARVSVRVHRDAASFTLIAAPDVWVESSRLLMVALFRDPPDAPTVERERAAVQAELGGRRANPADAITRAVDHAFFGDGHPWSRSPYGTPETVAALAVTDVDDYLRRAFVPARAVAAVVGPVSEREAREHLLPFIADDEGSSFEIPAPHGELLVRQDYDAITTWVAVAYPLSPGTDLAAARLLADIVAENLSFGPSRRSVYDVRSEALASLGGGELRVQVVVPPREAESWAEEIRRVVDRVSASTPTEALFERQLRHYRGKRLLSLSAPEDRAGEMARQLLLTGEVTTSIVGVDSLTAERLHAAARSLAEPTVVFLGPL